MKRETLGELERRRDELRLLINSYELELYKVERRIHAIIGGPEKTTLSRIYDDENPDYIRNTEDGI